MVPADAMPMTNSFGFQVDSGTFAETFDHALVRADLKGFAERRRQRLGNKAKPSIWEGQSCAQLLRF